MTAAFLSFVSTREMGFPVASASVTSAILVLSFSLGGRSAAGAVTTSAVTRKTANRRVANGMYLTPMDVVWGAGADRVGKRINPSQREKFHRRLSGSGYNVQESLF